MDIEINYQCPINGHQLVQLNLEAILIEKDIVIDPVVYSVKAISKDGTELDTYIDLKAQLSALPSAFRIIVSLCEFKKQSEQASPKSRDWTKFRQFVEVIEALD